jgi:hypothetical protein
MKRRSDKCLKEKLAKKHACYVLITCDPSAKDGRMEVEMSYEGDATLAAYILHGAQLRMDELEAPFHTEQNKIHYFE